MTRSASYDVVVIGGGVLGTAVAARIAMTTLSVCLLEAADDLAEGASKSNAGGVASYYAPPGTLEAELLARSCPRFEDLCARLDVPFQRLGSLTVALDEGQAEKLSALRADAIAAGARAELLTAEEARKLEPLITADCLGALHLPDEGLIDPMRLTWKYAEWAVVNGADVRLDHPVVGFDDDGDRLTSVVTPHGRFSARVVINAAGVRSGDVSALAGGEAFHVWPRKGQYWVLDRAFGEQMRKIVLPVPMPDVRGVQVYPTTNGSVLLGPDAADIVDPEDNATDGESLSTILEQTRRLVPSLTTDCAIKTYAGNRPAADETVRVRFDTQRANLVHVGNRSTGVSCSPATADLVAELVAEAGLDTTDRPDCVRALPRVRRLVDDPDPESLPEVDDRYRQVVCVCEQVTAAEIAGALDAHVPARSIEGVRKRTRATAGRCQGSVCMAGVAFMCSLHHRQAPETIRQGPYPATVGIGHVD